LQVGWQVRATNLPEGTRIKSVDDGTHATLSQAPTSSTTLNYTFNPMQEMGGPALIAGSVTTNVFTATTGFPFLADIVGATVFLPGTTSIIVLSVSGQSGTTGHYNAITMSTGISNGAVSLFFVQGCVRTFTNSGDEIFDMSQYGGYYFTWNGKDPMQRIEWRPRKAPTTSSTLTYDDILSVRPAGLNPVVDQVTLTTIATIDGVACAWPPTLATGYYWFLHTEIFDPDSTADGEDNPLEIESAYYGKSASSKNSGEPVAVNITALTGVGVHVVFPRPINTGGDGRYATHYGLYMFGPTQDNRTFPPLGGFKRVAKIRLTTAASSGTQSKDLSDSRTVQTGYSSVSGVLGSFQQFTNPTFMAAGIAGYNSSNNADAFSGLSGSAGGPFGNLLGNFGFVTGAPWSTRTIYGIRITVRGAADAFGAAGSQAGYLYGLTAGGASKTTDDMLGVFTRTSLDAQTHGGEMETFGVGWVAADLADGTFKVRLIKSPTGSVQHLRVTGVKVEVFFTSGSINLNGQPFRIVTFRDQIGDTVNEPANGVPPTCTTGDLFQGSLVTNDLGDETAIRFSLPGAPESFPKPYVMRFNTTKRRDRVTCIRTLGPALYVGMQNGIKRVNYLPSESDTDFHEGLAHEDHASDHGIAGPLAAVKFDWPGAGTVMAYASFAGVFLTDGVAPRPLNIDLDWPNTVKLSALSTCVFRVYPREKWLVLYYCPAGATHNKNTKALVFSYAADKLKDGGRLPVTGPITVSGRSSTEVLMSGTQFLLTGHETTGIVYQEDFGTVQASGYQVHNASNSLAAAPITPVIRTRRLHPAGITHDTHLYKAYLLYSAYGTTNTAVANSTITSTTLSSTSAVFTNVVAGMRAKGSSLDEGTIVLSVAGDFKSCVLSRAANATSAGVTFTFDTGAIALSDRGLSIGETAATMHTQWGSTLKGDMLVMQLDDVRQGLELQVEKVPLTFTTDADGYRYDTATWADLGVNMRLHQFMILFDDQGPEQTRSVA
jgi:hypothetical protein